jgi:hypothetical protein
MRIFARGTKLSNDVPVQRPHDADARHHSRPIELDDQEHSFDRGLPFLEILLSLRQLHDVAGGILQRDELATAGQGNRIVECAGLRHQLERGTMTAPLPANARAACSARFLSALPRLRGVRGFHQKKIAERSTRHPSGLRRMHDAR